MRVLGIEFAPLLISLERRLQTAWVAFWVHLFFFGGFGCLFLAIILLFTPLNWLVLLYLLWYWYDRATSEKGSRPWKWLRNSKGVKHAAHFFPASMHKTAELEPDRNYLLCFHPHGIPAFGAFLHFATNSTGFNELFPGLQQRLVVLRGNFQFPFYRELALLFGLVSSSPKSIEYLLDSRQGVGRATTLIVGGAREVLVAKPGEATLVLRSRKGFARLALKHGASLVPVFSFGEVDMYRQLTPNPSGSLIRKAQEALLKVTGIPIPTFYGRGVFNYSFGLVPVRTPLHAVVGAPIHVEKVAEPTQEQIDQLHQRYMNELNELFETHKVKYGLRETDKIVFV